ncbi:CHK1_7 [Blepharisma stoltei]|uniref:Phosphodiesterase n=1 Tax=Blepharisma stoltei TaxID=1481888 RepID=A0AAU9K2U8_9CILI|nr:unnamed protein product [Blepharisma stoltei]
MKENEESIEDNAITNQVNSAHYTIYEHQPHEAPNIPINQNVLNFTNRQLESKYFAALYINKDDKDRFSFEFKGNLTIYFIFYSAFLVIKTGSILIINYQGNLAQSHYLFHISCLIFLFCVAYLLLMLLKLYDICFEYNRTIFSSLTFFAILYLIIGEERILSGITKENFNGDFPINIPFIMGFAVCLKLVLFNNFRHFSSVGLSTIILYLILSLCLSESRIWTFLTEYFALLIFICFQLFETWQLDYRTRQLFYRKVKEEADVYQNKNIKEYVKYDEGIKSEVELVVKTCETIREIIKKARSVIMFKDIKSSLKEASNQLNFVQQKIARGLLMNESRLDLSIDADDRAFLSQNFMDVKSSPSATQSRRPTAQQMIENALEFPFGDYGLTELEGVLTGVGKNWNFDIWFVYNATGHSIFILSKYLFDNFHIKQEFLIPDKFIENYFKSLESKYNSVPYHNACHASDMLHSLLYFITQSNIIKQISTLDLLTCIIAADGHDVGHPGVTNRFLVNTKDELAIKYNDVSVLEMMHCATIFEVMRYYDHNIIANLNNEEWVYCRKLIIEMVLTTDMSKHFELLGRFRTRTALNDISLDSDEDKGLVFSIGIKCADIGHSAKPIELHEKWTILLCEEFFNQGDMERSRNLPISMYCDRNDANVPKAQFGFIKNVALPIYDVWTNYLDSEQIRLNCFNQLEKNLAYWDGKSVNRRKTLDIPIMKSTARLMKMKTAKYDSNIRQDLT